MASKKPTDSDPTWYDLYSDGKVEQGGYVDRAIGTTNVSITFPVAHSVAPTVLITKIIDSAVADQNSILVRTISLTGFTMNKLTANNAACWQVSGYAAESEYIDKIIRREFIAY